MSIKSHISILLGIQCSFRQKGMNLFKKWFPPLRQWNSQKLQPGKGEVKVEVTKETKSKRNRHRGANLTATNSVTLTLWLSIALSWKVRTCGIDRYRSEYPEWDGK
jgi:hypothetical protein